MRTHNPSGRHAASALAFGLLLVAVQHGLAFDGATPQYRAIPLPALPGAALALPKAINQPGAVAGDSGDGSGMIWADGEVTEIQPLPGSSVVLVRDINSSGQVVGESPDLDNEGLPTAFLYHAGNMTNLFPGLGAGEHATAVAINDAGMIVGNSFMLEKAGGFVNRAFVWQQGVATVIEPLPLADDSTAIAVNNNGDVLARSGGHTVIWHHGELTDLGTLEMTMFGFNDAGQIAGFRMGPSGSWDAVILDGKDFTSLPGLGDQGSQAWALNNPGQVVGASQVSSGWWHAALWRDGEVLDLNTITLTPIGATLTLARDINDAGDIAVQAVGPGGTVTAWLLTPAAAGDLNGDGVVGIQDLLQLIAAWGACPALCPADMDANSVVDVRDLLLLLAHWD